MLLNVTLEMGLATPCASVSLSKPKRMRSSPRLPSSSSVLQFHICDPCDPYRIKRCSQVTKGTKGRKSMCGCQEGRSTLTPRRQGSLGRPIPALGWQRTPGLPPQGENWAQARGGMRGLETPKDETLTAPRPRYSCLSPV